MAMEAPFKEVCFYLIKLYQQRAPKRIRGHCRFEPTCSTYMLLAIDKYGVFKGSYTGVKRILRCKAPNGGIDKP